MKKIIYELYTLVLSVILKNRRRSKMSELRHHIDMILDPKGCSNAPWHLEQCHHIAEHYHAKLSLVGFKGDFYELRQQMERSLQRARAREISSIADFSLQFR